MNELKNRIKALENLGTYFSDISDKDSQYDPLFDAIERANLQNGWFQREACVEAIQSWGAALQSKNISQWINQYHINENNSPKTIAVIMAGTFLGRLGTDLISIWISGNRALVNVLPKTVSDSFYRNQPSFQSLTSFADGKLEGLMQ